MYLTLFLYIITFFSLALGEFGQFPFGSNFSISITDILLMANLSIILIWNIGIRKNLKVPRNFFLLILFWAIGLLSLLFSVNLSGVLYLFRFILYSSSIYLAFHLTKSGIFGYSEFLSLLKITSLSVAVLGLIQILVFPDLEVLLPFGYDPHKYRVFSTFLDPNLLGAFLNFGFILLLYELISKKSKNLKSLFKENWKLLIPILILGLTILLTFSRSAYLMLAVSLIIILAAKNLKLLGIFALSVLLLYFISPQFNERISGALEVDKSASERFTSWQKGLIIFQYNPILGVGFNNIRDYSQEKNLLQPYSDDGGNAGSGIDSSLIFVLATTGLVGFIVFFLFLGRIILDLIKNLTSRLEKFYDIQFFPVKFFKRVFKVPEIVSWYRESTLNSKPYSLSLPLLGLSVGIIVNSFFINSLFFPPIIFVWYSLFGLFYGLGEGEGS